MTKVYSVNENGNTYWLIEGTSTYHREDGPAIEYADGTKSWWINGKRHRIDGPAIEYSYGGKWWFQYGMFHREDGPAVEEVDQVNNSYYYKDKLYENISSDEEWRQLVSIIKIID